MSQNQQVLSSIESMASLLNSYHPKEQDYKVKAERMAETASLISDTLLALELNGIPENQTKETNQLTVTHDSAGQPFNTHHYSQQVRQANPLFQSAPFGIDDRPSQKKGDSNHLVANIGGSNSTPASTGAPTAHATVQAVPISSNSAGANFFKDEQPDFFSIQKAENSMTETSLPKPAIMPAIESNLKHHESQNIENLVYGDKEKLKNDISELRAALSLSNSELQKASHHIVSIQARCDSLQSQNQEFSMKISLQALEMTSVLAQNESLRKELNQDNSYQPGHISVELKALFDQNEMLRNENKKLLQQEREILEENVKLNDSRLQAKSSGHHFLQKEKLLLQLDERISWIQSKKVQLASSVPFSGAKQFDIYEGYASKLHEMISILGAEFTEKQILDICSGIITILGSSSCAILESFEEIAQLDARIDKVRLEGEKNRIEMELAAKDRTAHVAEEIQALQEDNMRLTNLLSLAKKELNFYKGVNEQGGTTAKLITVPDQVGDDNHKMAIEVYQLQNQKLSAHILKLENNIREWKGEYSMVHNELLESNDERRILESSIAELKRKITKSNENYQSERVKNTKAAALIESMNNSTPINRPDAQEIGVRKDADIEMLEQSIEGKMRHMNNSLQHSQVHPSTMKILSERQETSRELEELSDILQKHVDRVKTLESQVNELAGTKKKLKQKFKLREQAWLEKTRSINEEYETLLVECDSNQKVLAAYKEQYEGIRKVSSAGDIENAGHPYSFSVCVARLDTKLLHSNHDIEMLRRENLKLTEAIASKIQLVDSNCLAKENLLEEKSGLTSTIDELLREIADLSQNNCSLEQQLTDALSAKTDSANKLKKIANAYQTMIKS